MRGPLKTFGRTWWIGYALLTLLVTSVYGLGNIEKKKRRKRRGKVVPKRRVFPATAEPMCPFECIAETVSQHLWFYLIPLLGCETAQVSVDKVVSPFL